MSVSSTSSSDETEPAAAEQPLLDRVSAKFTDGSILRITFYVLIVAVTATLLTDYRSMLAIDEDKVEPASLTGNPILPPFVPANSNEQSDNAPTYRPEVTSTPESLNSPMQFELVDGGVLKLTGYIAPGTAEEFKEKISTISSYVEVVELDSPGGSVADALAMSARIRESGWTTRVLTGHFCASSCPLVFAGGEKRIAEENSAIGVHQFYSTSEDTRSRVEAISGTQFTTAQITRHLEAMGVDPSIWVHALETPPRQLYYLSPEEMKRYKLTAK